MDKDYLIHLLTLAEPELFTHLKQPYQEVSTFYKVEMNCEHLKDPTLIKDLSARQYKIEPMQVWYDEIGINAVYQGV